MKNIENIFLNTKKYLLKETQNAMLIKAPKIPWFNEQIGIWFPKRFVYKGKYENSICIGIIKDSKYQIIFLILSKTLDKIKKNHQLDNFKRLLCKITIFTLTFLYIRLLAKLIW